jgi:hypothetical protein
MKYTVLKYDVLKTLIEDVNIHIKKGWSPLGGVSVMETRSGGYSCFVYAQAMIKNEL